MNSPTEHQLFGTLEATWPAAQCFAKGPWHIRDGQGGGQRVSAATPLATIKDDTEIDLAEAAMQALDQTPIFMIAKKDMRLDAMLENRGYAVVDPVTIYLVPAKELTAELKIASAIAAWPPLALQREIWNAGGIGPARLKVMERVAGPKTTILGRTADTPGGTAFIAMADDIAMIHAVEVAPEERRKGIGKRLMNAAANWAVGQKANWLTLAVTTQNEPANALYKCLGMQAVGGYHYRRAMN